MKITVYTITDCKFSQEEKEYLKGLNLPFEEKNLEQNKDWLTEMLTVSNNFAGTPVTVIEKDDGSKVVLKGFTKDEFEKELNVKGPAAAPVSTDAAGAGNGIGNDVMAGSGAAGSSAAAAMPAQAPVAPTAAAAGTPPEPTPEPAEPAVPAMPEVPAAAPEPAAPAMPPVSAPELPQTPAMPADAPAPAVANVPDLSAGVTVSGDVPAASPSAEPPIPSMPAAPEAVPAAPPVPAAPEPAAIAPAAPTTPTESATPAAAAPQVNDDALNAILNNLQAKVSDTPGEAPKQ